MGRWFPSGPQNPRLSVEGSIKAFYAHSLNGKELSVPRAQSIHSGHLQQGQGQAGPATPQPSRQETTQPGLYCQLDLQVPVGASTDTSQYSAGPNQQPHLLSVPFPGAATSSEGPGCLSLPTSPGHRSHFFNISHICLAPPIPTSQIHSDLHPAFLGYCPFPDCLPASSFVN